MMIAQIASQVSPLDKFHNDIIAVGALPIVIDLDDIGVCQRRRCARLHLEARNKLAVSAVDLAQYLHGNRPIHTPISGAVDGCHAAPPDGFQQFVTTAENLACHMPPPRSGNGAPRSAGQCVARSRYVCLWFLLYPISWVLNSFW